MEMNTLQEKNDDLQHMINDTLVDMASKIDSLMKDMANAQDDIIDNGIDVSYVKGVVSLNQIDIERHDNSISEIITDIEDLIEEHNFIIELFQVQGFQCINDIVLKIPGNITSVNYPANYPSMCTTD